MFSTKTINKLNRRAFTMVEILVVMSIIFILMGAVGFGIFRNIGSQKVRTSAQMLANDIGLANQTAAKLNTAIEIRFYSYDDPAIPGNVTAFRAWQLLKNDSKTGKMVPFDDIHRLDNGVVFLADPTYSSVFSTLKNYNNLVDPELAIGNYSYAAFKIKPDGTTSLGKQITQKWSLTLVKENPNGNTSLPDNYSTLVINPFTGNVRIY